MKSANAKVIRMLKAMAVLMKDEDPALLLKMHKTINDEEDGYDFDFLGEVYSVQSQVQGKSY